MIFKQKNSGLFCISFDSVAMSGIIVELLKVAKVFYDNDYLIYLDLGYEIKADKNNFFIPYSEEKKIIPHWINLVKTIDHPFYDYSEDLILAIFQSAINESKISSEHENLIENYSNYISERLIILWNELNIKYILVENGTLPENIIFTKAIYKAIEIYGKQNNFKKYVIWRNHDLMWSSEANIYKYGKFPYQNTPKFSTSRFISNVVLHDADYNEALNWCPSASISVLRNNFQVKKIVNYQKTRDGFRKLYNIPESAFLLARSTRIIPQKRIDRDIYLVNFLYQIAKSQKNDINIYLAIAGNPHENFDEYLRLKKLISEFKLEDYVFFTGNLKPIELQNDDENNLESLILASDLCSFMTSYHYDSFGNPIAEAISLGKPYIATSYKQYKHVYGDLGYQGLIFPISEDVDEQVNEHFAKKVYELLLNQDDRDAIVAKNTHIMKSYTQNNSNLIKALNKLLDSSLINE